MVRAAVSSIFKSSKSLCVLFWKVGRDAEWFPSSQLKSPPHRFSAALYPSRPRTTRRGRIHFGCQTKQSSSSSFWISRLFSIVFALEAHRLSDGLIVFRSSFLERRRSPAKSVRKPPGSTMVTFTPEGATSSRTFRRKLPRPISRPHTAHGRLDQCGQRSR